MKSGARIKRRQCQWNVRREEQAAAGRSKQRSMTIDRKAGGSTGEKEIEKSYWDFRLAVKSILGQLGWQRAIG